MSGEYWDYCRDRLEDLEASDQDIDHVLHQAIQLCYEILEHYKDNQPGPGPAVMLEEGRIYALQLEEHISNQARAILLKQLAEVYEKVGVRFVLLPKGVSLVMEEIDWGEPAKAGMPPEH